MFKRILAKFGENKRDVPLLRVIFIAIHLFNLITTTLLHNNQMYKYRSAYKRIDIASVFMLAPGLSFPVAVYIIKNDRFVATLVCLQWILSFIGVFGSLVFDFCSFQKEYRSVYVLVVNLPDLLLIYKLLAKREYLSFLLSASCLVCFFSGGIVYCREGPPIIDGIVGHHEIFHLLTVIGFGLVVGSNRFLIK